MNNTFPICPDCGLTVWHQAAHATICPAMNTFPPCSLCGSPRQPGQLCRNPRCGAYPGKPWTQEERVSAPAPTRGPLSRRPL